MSNDFSSAKKDISISGAEKGGKLNPKALLAGMSKDVSKRWMIVGTVGTVGIALLAATLAGDGGAPRVKVAKPETAIETSPKGLTNQKDWKAQTGAELLTLKNELEDSRKAQREVLSRLEAMRLEMGKVKEGIQRGGVAQPAAPANGLNLNIPAPPVPPKTAQTQSTYSPAAVTQPGAPLAPSSAVATTAPAVDAPVKRSAAKAFIPTSSKVSATENSSESYTEDLVPNERKGFLPGGSFAPATLISGVEAFTGGTAQAQPQPIVVRVDANAVLPNAANYQIKGCHALASVWGDMSSERVFGRLASLTCVDSENKLVLSEEVEGVLVDSDGKNGIRGSLQDRQGAKLARSLLAGFAQGLSSAFGSAQSTINTTPFGTTSSVMGQDQFRAAGYAGASTATKQLADFYLKQAEATMPVIAVDAGRKVSILFTKSKALKFETTEAYRVKPKDKLQVERASR